MDDSKSFGRTVLERAKAKKETKSEKLPKQILPVDMSKDQFDDLKKRLEDCLNAKSDEERENAESKLKNPHTISDQLKIMNSGIFLDGHLRGKPLTGSARRYEKYQIDDIEGLVAEVADQISIIHYDFSKEVFDCIYLLYLDFTSDHYEELITALRKRFGIRKANQMEDIKNQFMALKKEIIPESTFGGITVHTLRHFENPKRTLHKNADNLFDLFKKHIPHAPAQTIADRISDLLNEFNIKIKAKTILQRRHRSKR